MALRINGEVVADDWIYQEFSKIKSYYERLSQVSCCERDEEFRGYAKENIIGQVLLIQASEKAGLVVNEDDLAQALQRFKAECGGEDAYHRQFGGDPNQENLLLDHLKKSLLVDQYLNQEFPKVEPAWDDLALFYQEHSTLYLTPEEIRASHIFKSFPRGEHREEVFQILRDARKRIQNGEEFYSVACEVTDKPKEEIDLGYFKRGDLMEEFELVAFSMNIGEVSPVFASMHGFHIAQVTDRKPPELRPLEHIQEEVKRHWQQVHRENSMKTLVDRLKLTAQIESDTSEMEGH